MKLSREKALRTGFTARARAAAGVLYRDALISEERAIDEEARTAEFVASTENPVMTWWGPEVLRMSGARMRRFKKNPVVLDSHNSWTIKSILGTAEVWIDDRTLRTKIRYDETDEGEAAWKRVKSGSLRAVSIGYRPNRKKTLQLLEGETDGKGDALVTGPALVCREWELIEITNCPVPADEDAVRRSFYTTAGMSRQERTMARKRNGQSPYELARNERELDDEDNFDEEGEQSERQPAPAPRQRERSSLPLTQEERDEIRGASLTEARGRKRAAIDAQIRAFTPEGLKDVADDAILRGLDVEPARKLLLEEKAKRQAPVGTPEPETDTTNPEVRAQQLPEDLTDELLVRSFEQLQ